MPVTTRIITADNGSSRRVAPTSRSPDVIQRNAVATIARDSGGSARSRETLSAEAASDMAIAAQATAPDVDFDSRRPMPAFTRKPKNGKRGIRSNIAPVTISTP